MQDFQKFGVIGGGAWGTALATALIRAGRDVVLWARDKEVVESINNHNKNDIYLSGIELPESLKATNNLSDLYSCDAWLWVAPVQYSRDLATKIDTNKKIPILLCSKGIELKTNKFPSEILEETLNGHIIAVLSGPSFANEVATEKPTAITLACKDKEVGMKLCNAISSKYFRPYFSDDVIGAQIGGALKNIMAIATGISVGCKMGDNAKSAIITRGLAEIMRFGKAIGAKTDTLMGLSGLGDLVLTCSSLNSRNMSLGYELGLGKSLKEITSNRKTVSEGVPTTSAAASMAKKYDVEMPIVMAVNDVLNNGKNVQDAITKLLDRPIKAELD